MVKKIVFIFILISSISLQAQKPQKIAFIDMEYILENIPAYDEAQRKLDIKVGTWKSKIEKSQKEIENLKIDLANEKVLLTEDIIIEREEEITIKEIELKKLEDHYFGANGSLFVMRQQLVKPIQDEVFNAIQMIVKRKGYDFVFDRSSDLIMLHANPKYDISKMVITYITKSQKEIEQEEARLKKEKSREALKQRIEKQKQKRVTKESKIIHR